MKNIIITILCVVLMGVSIACQNENSRSNDKQMFSNLIGSEISLINGDALFGACIKRSGTISNFSGISGSCKCNSCAFEFFSLYGMDIV